MMPKTLLLILMAGVVATSPSSGQDDPLDQFKRLPKEAKAVLDAAEKLELYSLDPAGGMLPKDAPGFHGWKVLGKTEVKEADALKKVRAALHKGVAQAQGVAGCFRPRHGVRATVKSETVDLVICFECSNLQVFAGDKVQPVWTSASPQKTLDGFLRDAKVPLPRQKDE